jgi:hypothetical protein
MSDLTTEQLRRVVLNGLRKVGERFAEDPTPTDGTIQAAIAKMRRAPAGGRKTKAKALRPGRRRSP